MKRKTFAFILALNTAFFLLCSFVQALNVVTCTGAIDYVNVVKEIDDKKYIGSSNNFYNYFIKNRHNTKSIRVKYQRYNHTGVISTETEVVEPNDRVYAGGSLYDGYNSVDVRLVSASFVE